MSSWCNKPIVTDYNFKKERKKKRSLCPPVGPPPTGSTVGVGWVVCCGSRGQRPWRTDPWQPRLAVWIWNISSLVGKDPGSVCEVERYQPDIIRLTSTHGLSSGTSVLVERRQAGVRSLVSPRLPCLYVGAFEWEGLFSVRPGQGAGPACHLCRTIDQRQCIRFCRSKYSVGHGPLLWGIWSVVASYLVLIQLLQEPGLHCQQ